MEAGVGEDEAGETRSAGALVVDLAPVLAFADAIEALKAAWANVPPGARMGLSELLWLHPNGEVVAYRVPGEPSIPTGGR
jgi:hypothetical protein